MDRQERRRRGLGRDQDRHDDVLGQDPERRDPQRPGVARHGAGGQPGLDRAGGGPGGVAQRGPGAGQDQPPADPIEQRRAQAILEEPEGPRHRRRGQAQAARRANHRADLGDLDEGRQPVPDLPSHGVGQGQRRGGSGHTATLPGHLQDSFTIRKDYLAFVESAEAPG
jgi:hypothetical protein